MKVLFCDNHVLAVEKPANMVTQPTLTSNKNLQDLAKEWIQKKYHKKERVFLECIHRLDKLVSGIVVFARTSKALQRLQKDMREKKIKKKYLALVEGDVVPKRATLTHFLSHGKYKAIESKQGKIAILKYAVKKSTTKISLVEIELITGRYHQIRAQFSRIGHPILGDKKYNSSISLQNKIALHHFEMTIHHPVTKEGLTFTSNPSFPIEQFLSRTSGQKR